MSDLQLITNGYKPKAHEGNIIGAGGQHIMAMNGKQHKKQSLHFQ